jgi:meiotic recombination protein SPO11
MSIYKYGSAQLSHENAALVVPRLQYLGVETSDITSCADLDKPEEHLLHLTTRDMRKAACMLDSPVFAEDGPEPERRRDLQVMLMLSYKAEMQVFGEGGEMLEGVLRGKMSKLEKMNVDANENEDGDDSMLLE